MFRTPVALLCFAPLMLAVAAAPQSRSRAASTVPAAADTICGDATFEQYLRWHNDAAHRMTAIVSVSKREDRAGPLLTARACAGQRLSIRA
jgi:hypothetical protein